MGASRGRSVACLGLAVGLLLVAGCSRWFASLEALIWYAPLPDSLRIFVFDGSGSTAQWTKIREYRWEFGDGSSATGATATHSYASEGTYTVSLTVGNGRGVFATDSASLTIHGASGNQPPSASFTVVPSTGPAPLTVRLDASGSSDVDGSIEEYVWDFGDGTTAVGVSASHTYGDSGRYVVTLEVTDDDGSSDVATKTVRVTDTDEPDNQSPIARFSTTPSGGELPLLVAFDGTDSFDADGEIVTYSWDFGDGATLSGGNPTPSHLFVAAGEFDVQLTVIDEDGAADTTAKAITVTSPESPMNAPPVARFTADPDSGDAPLAVALDADSSTDSDGYIVAYHWEFGDGDVLLAGDDAPYHIYTAPGMYTVTLTVVDEDGAADSASTQVRVLGGNESPDAQFTAAPTSGVAPLDVEFDASSSADADGTIVAYSWSYGDGTSGSGVTCTHRYGPGDYDATLTVQDDDGATDSTTRTIHVDLDLPPMPQRSEL